MFVNKLDVVQQGILLDWASRIVHADGVVDEKEETLLQQVRMQCSTDAKSVSVEVGDLSKHFSDERAKKYFLLEMIGLCYIDGEYHATEKDIIQSVSQSLDLSAEEVRFMEAWVEEQFGLMEQISIFVGD